MYTKQRHIMQYTEVVYYRDGVEIGRDRVGDDHLYDTEPPEEMSDREVEDWG